MVDHFLLVNLFLLVHLCPLLQLFPKTSHCLAESDPLMVGSSGGNSSP